MKIELRDENTVKIVPEDISELLFLRKLEKGKIELEKPRPFDTNIEVLLITKEKDV
jgi:hypothetical protein